MKTLCIVLSIVLAGCERAPQDTIASAAPTPTPEHAVAPTVVATPAPRPTRWSETEITTARGAVVASNEAGALMECSDADQEYMFKYQGVGVGVSGARTAIALSARDELRDYGPLLQVRHGRPEPLSGQPSRFITGIVLLKDFPKPLALGQHLRVIVAPLANEKFNGQFVKAVTAVFETHPATADRPTPTARPYVIYRPPVTPTAQQTAAEIARKYGTAK